MPDWDFISEIVENIELLNKYIFAFLKYKNDLLFDKLFLRFIKTLFLDPMFLSLFVCCYYYLSRILSKNLFFSRDRTSH